MSKGKRTDDIPISRDLVAQMLMAHRTVVVALEKVAERSARAAVEAREKLTILELE